MNTYESSKTTWSMIIEFAILTFFPITQWAPIIDRLTDDFSAILVYSPTKESLPTWDFWVTSAVSATRLMGKPCLLAYSTDGSLGNTHFFSSSSSPRPHTYQSVHLTVFGDGVGTTAVTIAVNDGVDLDVALEVGSVRVVLVQKIFVKFVIHSWQWKSCI